MDFKAGSWKLYDDLVSEYRNAEPLDDKEMQAMALILRGLDLDGLKIVGLLIRAYGEDKHNNDLPFGGAHDEENSSAQFDMRKFDPCLQRMLIHFGMMHHAEKQK